MAAGIGGGAGQLLAYRHHAAKYMAVHSLCRVGYFSGVTMASVLLIEDETLIRMMMADMLIDLGHTVAAEAGDLSAGLALAQNVDCDAAIIDLLLGDEHSDEIAQVLKSRKIPFAFASGFGAGGVPEQFRDCPVLQKPFPIDALSSCLTKLLRSVA